MASYQFGDFTRSLLGMPRHDEGEAEGEAAARPEPQAPPPPLPSPQRQSVLQPGAVAAAASLDDSLSTPPTPTTSAAATTPPPTSPRKPKKAPQVMGCVWPDPDPTLSQAAPTVDDVSRMNATAVSRVFFVRTEADIQHVVGLARREGRPVCVRGTKHSMGGHTIAPDGFVIDTARLCAAELGPETAETGPTVRCGSGILWCDLIAFLNQHGLSPRTMQSYSTFSVGGSMGVNAHGITNDFPLAECILAFRLVLWDGEIVECSRDAEGRGRELFSLVIGGYGLFGIVSELLLKVDPNARLYAEVVQCNPEEFDRFYDSVLADDTVDIKLARLNVLDPSKISLFLFRRTSPAGSRPVSALPRTPREMSRISRLMYKWILPAFKPLRYAMEEASGQAMDWDEAGERNLLMFESAEPLARLYSPLFAVNDTFILQEFFVPKSQLRRWLKQSREVYAKAAACARINLLNTTIRFVRPDRDTMLPYSASPEGSFAFVLYYRVQCTPEGDAELQAMHELFTRLTLDCDGTFYLPYRHHYSVGDVQRAYPGVAEFVRLKRLYDPTEMFVNQWYLAYLQHLAPPVSGPSPSGSATPNDAAPGDAEPPPAAATVPVVSERRTASYRTVFRDLRQRQAFVNGFLTQIFNLESNVRLDGMIAKALLDPRMGTDLEVYASLQLQLSALGGFVHDLTRNYRGVRLLQTQRAELVRETTGIVARLGRMSTLDGYVSIGDQGKLVLALSETLALAGRVWVVHDTDGTDIPSVLERGSLDHVGDFVPIDYEFFTAIDIPDASADLVTMNQGLHHLPQAKLPLFLAEVRRVLRPGGMFIVREHDALPELVPILDLAHSVFNAVTGVPLDSERGEVRAFRPVAAWREILAGAGFDDSYLTDMEPGDVTKDEMLCFLKPGSRAAVQKPQPPPKADSAAGEEPQPGSMLDDVPAIVLETLTASVDGLLEVLPQMRDALRASSQGLSGGKQLLAEFALGKLFDGPLAAIRAFRPHLDNVELQDLSGSGPIPKEFLLLYQALTQPRAGAKVADMTPSEVMTAALMREVMDLFSSSATPGAGTSGAAGATAAAPTRTPDVTIEDVTEMVDTLLAAMPGLAHDDALDKGGFPKRVQGMIRAKLEGADREGCCRLLVQNLDSVAWSELRAAVEQVVAAAPGPAREFTFANLQAPSSPWFKVAMAYLGSPFVQLSRSQLFLAGIAGLGPATDMWRAAQEHRAHAPVAPGVLRQLSVGSESDARRALAGLQDVAHSVTMTASQHWDVHGVVDITKAVYGTPGSYRSYTKHVRKHFFRGSSILLGDCDFADHFSSPHGRGGAGSHLVLSYTSSTEPPPEVLEPLVAKVSAALTSLGVLRPLHAEDGHYTWYKLSEWMQVEFVQVFGRAMETSPWFRFPFMEFLHVYGRVLLEEFKIVYAKHGLGKAGLSMAFLTDVIPGLVMALLFGQMQLLALPLKWHQGAEYPDPAGMAESILIQTGSATPDWARLDRRIQAKELDPGLWLLTVPTFKPLTEILQRLASVPQARVLEISNNKEMQVKVAIASKPQLETLRAITGVEVMFAYTLPTDGDAGPPKTNVSLCVKIPYLLHALRVCQRLGITVVQAYDWWC